MKKLNLVFAAIAALSLNTASAAQVGVASSGGGDSCERQIKEIAADISKWIARGDSRALNLPNGVTHEQYQKEMLVVLAPDRVTISCPDSFDHPKYKKIYFEHAQKTCIRYLSESNGKMHIDCDFNRFNTFGEKLEGQAEQYRLIHHEFAGLAGLETSKGASSRYEISDQITSHLKKTEILRLVVPYRNEFYDRTNFKLSCGDPNKSWIQLATDENGKFAWMEWVETAVPGDGGVKKHLGPEACAFTNTSFVSRFMLICKLPQGFSNDYYIDAKRRRLIIVYDFDSKTLVGEFLPDEAGMTADMSGALSYGAFSNCK